MTSATTQNPVQIGKYQIQRELGKGAMGIVYEGLDPLIERHVAIKVIQKSLINDSDVQEVFSRFRREAQAAGRLNHPNIISVYEYGENNDSAFIAMELIQGKELKDYFNAQQRFETPLCIGIMKQLLEALEYSHNKGVVHRDIKPSNIMITREGQVKIADFGIAKIESSDLTQAGTVLGTPTYMSPEQVTGINVDHRSDIYSAGVILYQFLTGERPFTGTLTAIMHKVLNEVPVPPITHNPAISTALNNVVTKAMAKRPEDRFQSAAEFLKALLQAANVSATPAAPATDADATLAIDKTIALTQAPQNAQANSPNSEIGTLAKQQAAQATETIQPPQAEARHRTMLEAKRQREIEEQADRSNRLAALKAAADARQKAEQAEQARRAQMKAAAKSGTTSARPGQAQPAPAAGKISPAENKPAPSAMPETLKKRGFFAWLGSLFAKK